ncbi:MAG: DUF4919 domain-containing protein [FCB group bacterium]|jgi:hypothetical protein
MHLKKLILVYFILIFAGVSNSYSQHKTIKPDFNQIGKYDDLITQLKSRDTSVNFYELRMAFTQSPYYNPYSTEISDLRKKMYDALILKNYINVLEYANRILDSNYLDLFAHFFSDESYQHVNLQEEAKYHRFIWRGLLNSIIKSGDGLSPETAHLVISSSEEYFVLFIYGFESKKQTTQNFKSESIDAIEAVNSKTKDTLTLYFNTTLLLYSYKNRN